METLIQARPYILAAFFLSLVAFGVGVFIDNKALLQTGAMLAHTALFLFILTESFGSVSRKRSRFSRGLARVAFIMSGFVVTGIVINLFLMAFSS